MYKCLLTLVALSVSQLSIAGESAEIWSCVDSSKMEVKASWMMNVLETHTNDNFYIALEETSFAPQTDAFATITHFPAQNLIVVKSLEAKLAILKKQESTLVAANY